MTRNVIVQKLVCRLQNLKQFNKHAFQMDHDWTNKKNNANFSPNQVIKSKKEEFAKGQRPHSSIILAENQKKEEAEALERDKVKDKTVIEGLSYGQSSGLKDDLDVDDDVGEKKRLAFLDLLLESSQNGVLITDTEIKEQVDTIMFEVNLLYKMVLDRSYFVVIESNHHT